MASHSNPHTVDITSAADMLRTHPRTVMDLIHSGTLPAAKVGRAWVMMTHDVLAYLDRQITQQTASRMGINPAHLAGRARLQAITTPSPQRARQRAAA